MDINQIIAAFFFDYTDLVLYDKSTGKTLEIFKLYDRTSNAPQFIEFVCNSSGTLTVTQTDVLPSGYDTTKSTDYDFDNGQPTESTAYDIFLSNENSPCFVIGIGDIRDLAATGTPAYFHKYRLIHGIVLSTNTNDDMTVYFKYSGDKSTITV